MKVGRRSGEREREGRVRGMGLGLAEAFRLVVPSKGRLVETDSRAKFGEETVTGAHRRPKWVLYYGA
jgi:hypothetical protein